jgi:hypothetical protein
MKNISRGPTYGDFVTILTEGSIQEYTVVVNTGVKTTLSPLS